MRVSRASIIFALGSIGPSIHGWTSCMRRRFSSRRVAHERDTCFIVCCAIGQLLERGSSMRQRCYWTAFPDFTAGDSVRQIYDLDLLVARDEDFAPGGVKI